MTSVTQSIVSALAAAEHAKRLDALRQYWAAALGDAGLLPANSIDATRVADALKVLGKTLADLQRDSTQLRMATDVGGHVADTIAKAEAEYRDAEAARTEHRAQVAALQEQLAALQKETFPIENRVLAASNARDAARTRQSAGERRNAELQSRADFAAMGGWLYLEQLRNAAQPQEAQA